MNRPPRSTAPSLACAAFSLATAWSQEIPSPEGVDLELHALEKRYAEHLSAVRDELGAPYLAALKRLQDSLAERGELEQALLVQNERRRVADLLGRPPQIGAPAAAARPPAAATLPVERARVSGGVRYDERRAALLNWTAAGGTATWALDADHPAGRYELIVTFTAGRDAGGSFEVTTLGGASARGSVETTPQSDWAEARQMLAGTFEIDADSRELSITATSLQQPYLWALSGAELVPEGTWEKRQSAAPATAFDLPGGKPKPD